MYSIVLWFPFSDEVTDFFHKDLGSLLFNECNYVFIVISFRCINLRVNSVPQIFILFPCRWVIKRDSFFYGGNHVDTLIWQYLESPMGCFEIWAVSQQMGHVCYNVLKFQCFQLCQSLTTSVSDKIFSRHSLPVMSFKNSFFVKIFIVHLNYYFTLPPPLTTSPHQHQLHYHHH